jgi:hypothetical protein
MSFRTLSTRLSVSVLTGLLLAGAPAAVHAQGGSRVTNSEGDRAGFQAERRKLAADLERANRDIEQLKQKDRGVRDDYRLRARMADAEAIARRLTEVETRLGTSNPQPTAPRPADAALRQASTDGPTELEAKADILTDQSRRLAAQADVLGRRLISIKDRQELRRRAGQLESDPFAPLEGSKRRVISTIATAAGGRSLSDSAPGSITPPPARGGQEAPQVGVSGPPRAPETTTMTPTAGSPSPAAPVGLTGSDTAAPAGAKSLSPTAVGAPTPAPMPSPTSSAALSIQLRDLLDANSLAAIRKLEMAGTTGANLEALERAAAALRERAQLLQGQSDALRAHAREKH